jgi:hypothetical protein
MAFQNITPAKLGNLAVTASFQTVYLTPASIRALVKDINICNTTAGALTVDLCVVPSGGTAGTSNAVLFTTSVAAGASYRWQGLIVMNPGDSLQVRGSAVGLTIFVSGAEAV